MIAGMCAGADCIDDVDLVRSGGMRTLLDGVYAPSTVGTLLREFTFGHARQLESVLREHLVALCGRVDLLPGAADQRVFVDIDSLLRPVYGHAKQGAPYGHTKIAGKQIVVPPEIVEGFLCRFRLGLGFPDLVVDGREPFGGTVPALLIVVRCSTNR